jgi:hypothetical protein
MAIRGLSAQTMHQARAAEERNADQIIDLHDHPLMKLKPDDWKNIPFCMIDAVKLVTNALVNMHAQQERRHLDFEEFKAYQQKTNKQVQAEFGRKEDSIMAAVDRVEKNLTNSFNKQRVELEN